MDGNEIIYEDLVRLALKIESNGGSWQPTFLKKTALDDTIHQSCLSLDRLP